MEYKIIEDWAERLNKKDYRELCNEVFGESGKRNKKDYCRICRMALPKVPSLIDYEGQILHLLEYHNIEEISKFLKISIKSKTICKSININNYYKATSKTIILNMLKEFEGMNIKITVENILTDV